MVAAGNRTCVLAERGPRRLSGDELGQGWGCGDRSNPGLDDLPVAGRALDRRRGPAEDPEQQVSPRGGLVPMNPLTSR